MSDVKYWINGKVVTEKEWKAKKGAGLKFGGPAPMASKTYTQAKPWICESMGVLPNQVAEERAKLAKRKDLTAVEILDDGAVQCTSRGKTGRLGWFKYRKAIDADGGYGETYNSRS